MSDTRRYARPTALLHPSPPTEARFFYTSPVPIDDPLSPVPPPAGGKSAAAHAPKPFSEYDNTALERAWHALRRETAKYREERGRREKSSAGSRERARSKTTAGGGREGQRRASSSRPAAPRNSLARQAAKSLSGVDGPPALDRVETLPAEPDEPPAEVAVLPDTTGTPFIRAPSGKRLSDLRGGEQQPTPPRPKPAQHDTYTWEDAEHLLEHTAAPRDRRGEQAPRTSVPVGVSRLHKVEMPELVMQPIYWTPIHDTAQVVRGTWFYQDTMLPVERDVANMLELGYLELQAWTETWRDELASAVEVGAAGEEKIVHKLWPDKLQKAADSRPGSRKGGARVGGDPDLLRTATLNLIEEVLTPEQQRDRAVEAACELIDVATGLEGHDNKAAGQFTAGRHAPPRTYANHGVIYSDERHARILAPSLLPSAYYGRRPYAGYIRKDYKLGVRVVRGFDQLAWDKLHPPLKKSKADKRAEHGVATSEAGDPTKRRRRSDPDLAKADRPRVTDLVLVIHGIGQKLSQRMESFHFTHAMNAFRRDVNVEVGTPSVAAHFRRDMGGIMVLPVNWRHTLSFEEGGFRDGPERLGDNEFSLHDITPDTLPSVRNIVSDVMLDIPYYLSHHQPRMIAAVVREANRVFQLWCQHNPGFAEHGRVHLIGHSLGSVMAIDILSRQPTTIPAHLQDPTALDLAALEAAGIDHFLFRTHHLFLAGSPAGFFLLLKKAQLRPRIGFASAAAAADPGSNNLDVCGERGQYGCVAAENVYNIINGYDPVSYRMNAAVDAAYAATLKQAWIPTTAPGWFGGRKTTSSNSSSSTAWFSGSSAAAAPAHHPSPLLPRLPSNVEMETHNFTREEIAEKRMWLLNDNGQIDFFLRYGGGPLEIQYLTMLGAHSSYWLLRDFTRMIVGEVGRPVGRGGTRESLRGVKKPVRSLRDA